MSDATEKPKRDFTLYTNEKGETVKTTERVIKGKKKMNFEL